MPPNTPIADAAQIRDLNNDPAVNTETLAAMRISQRKYDQDFRATCQSAVDALAGVQPRVNQLGLTLTAVQQASAALPATNSHLANIGTQLSRIATALESIAVDVRRPFTGGA